MRDACILSGQDAFRQGAERQSLGRAIKDAPQYVLDGRVVLNDISSYDFVIYATETFGVRRLGEVLAERFGVEHEFIGVPNPV